MKKVLLIKMSSMGDVIHTLPALTDAQKAIQDIQFDWVVEPAFSEIPAWHPAVKQIIKAPIRAWRKHLFRSLMSNEISDFIRRIRQTEYDLILDPQGLLKSALVGFMAKGCRAGYHSTSARESISSLFYKKKFTVDKKQHAVEKVRRLFAKVFNYPYQPENLDYGIDTSLFEPYPIEEHYVVFLHGTTWATKHWPIEYWKALAQKCALHNQRVLLPWGSIHEKRRAEEIKEYCQQKGLFCVPIVLPKLSLAQITAVLAKAKAIVAVDTGLGHMSAMMAVPTISLYGPTYPGYTGAYGHNQNHLTVQKSCHPCFERNCPKAQPNRIYPPCFETLDPDRIWHELQKITTKEKQIKVSLDA